jgi:hypothetical protein
MEARNISCPCRESNPYSSTFYLVPLSLYRLSYPGWLEAHTEQADAALTLYACIRELMGSNFFWGTCCSDFRDFIHFLQANYSTANRPRHLSSKSFSIHYSEPSCHSTMWFWVLAVS